MGGARLEAIVLARDEIHAREIAADKYRDADKWVYPYFLDPKQSLCREVDQNTPGIVLETPYPWHGE